MQYDRGVSGFQEGSAVVSAFLAPGLPTWHLAQNRPTLVTEWATAGVVFVSCTQYANEFSYIL